MASIFKRRRDKDRKGSYWYISYNDENGCRKSKRGFTDKRATKELALELEHQVRRRREGLIDPADEKRKSAATTPITDHLDAFKKSLGHNTNKHVGLTYSRIKKMIDEADLKTLADIEVETLEAVLGDMLEADEIGRRTYNHYVQSMHSFCEWLVPSRLTSNPIAGMKRLNTEVDIRHQRRALTAAEFDKLVKSARESNVSIQCFDGEQRARIYTISYMTGLRRKEIASLASGRNEHRESVEGDGIGGVPRLTISGTHRNQQPRRADARRGCS